MNRWRWRERDGERRTVPEKVEKYMTVPFYDRTNQWRSAAMRVYGIHNV
jgi:hypothetical protein